MYRLKHIHLIVLICLNLVLFDYLPAPSFETKNHQVLDDIVAELQSLQGVQIKRVDIELTITQPLNHDDPFGSSFEQQVILIHKDFNKPVVFWIEGYAIKSKELQEVTQILDANQIIVEHRYFGESTTDSLDWRYLNIRQAAADHHRIVKLFKSIYPGKWIRLVLAKAVRPQCITADSTQRTLMPRFVM